MAASTGDKQVISTPKSVVKTMDAYQRMANGMKMLSSFDGHLSTMTQRLDSKREIDELEETLEVIEEKIMGFESGPSESVGSSMIWDRDPEEAFQYLQAVDQVRELVDQLEKSSLITDERVKEILDRAHSLLQIAMAKLEEEFIYVLVQCRQPLEPDFTSFRSSEDDLADRDSISSSDFQVDECKSKLGDNSNAIEQFQMDLIVPEMIPELKRIAKLMYSSNYDRECFQAYTSIRRDALDEFLFILKVEKLSIEEVQRMDWKYLESMIRRWIRAIKLFVRFILVSEKYLCDQIFGDLGSTSEACFVEITKGPIMQLLNFGEAVAITHRSTDRLYCVIDMYERLADLLPDINSLFPEDMGFSVRGEAREVLARLGEYVKRTLVDFEEAIRKETSANPFAGGGVHHLTRYVMNYIRTLATYSDILNPLLDSRGPLHSSLTQHEEEENDGYLTDSVRASPMAQCLLSLTHDLESNLDAKSQLYRDESLRHFFLMNNIHYMFQKVRESEGLSALLGDDWVRAHSRVFRKHEMSYERASWNEVLHCLRDEGLGGSSSSSNALLKERFKSFNLAFEELYRNQTGWHVRDPQLREDLQISISMKILQAYRMFIGRYRNQLEGVRHSERYMKYSAEDLETYLLDLFEGSPRLLHNPRRR
ncbi:hypothetical protein AMTRI_Chr10g1510 [Amborella trichopoda]|uniref:Exocyst subunit Exo70 family protein n=1 Tax=Amborella trichopoda TaxID=13333 RepID=W1PIG8_AMBTC|nr:exocyst complex component EXO70B1 [Amborella trichopoda]ERN07519.1 hypothetical protein AMTR_s00154p00032290 [Amborella trichopoda]|eukprot:XP_006845844.1 exocyst complex component EXO70B1 [Amborella trichopoda]